MATLPYPFLRRSRCGVLLTETGGLRHLEEWIDATLRPMDSASQETVEGNAAFLQAGVGRQFTSTNACEGQTDLTNSRE